MRARPVKTRMAVMLNNGLIIDNTYQIISEIGSGGMGIIYLGYHMRLRKYIVLKKLKDSSKDINTLRNEVDILKGLRHSYLPQVYDFISYNGSVYTVIDYIEGYDLKYYIDNQYRPTEGQLIKWLRQLCEVLDYIHSHNPQVLHSDIKPANIIINKNGDICLIDFGISLYNTKVILGLSKNYSSPEQFYNYECIKNGVQSNVAIDERTDIYSVGATFYHLMTGIRPVVDRYITPLSECNTGYSQQLVEIIEKAMSYNSGDRFSSARQMLKAVDNMKKRDLRYKKWLLLQFLTSFVSVALVVGGILMVVSGYQRGVASSYEREYSEFVTLVSRGSGEVAEKGRSLLNNADYKDVIDDSTEADILHAIGDYYYYAADFKNAAYNYGECVKLKDSELNYRDLAMALIADSRLDEAQSVINSIQSEYSDSAVISLLNADIALKQGDFQDAADTIDGAMHLYYGDSENLYTANIIKAQALDGLNRIEESVASYKEARTQKENAAVLRMLGAEHLKQADRSGTTLGYSEAFGCFRTIAENFSPTTDDLINLAQSALLAGENTQYEYCKKKLLAELEKEDNCRLYMILSILGDETADNQTEGYLQKTKSLYDALSEDEKGYISQNTLSEIKKLYKKYCGQEWL